MAGVAFDSWMSIDLSQRLRKAGINMVEVTQTASNQGPMANQLIDLIRQHRLTMYSSKELRLAVSRRSSSSRRAAIAWARSRTATA